MNIDQVGMFDDDLKTLKNIIKSGGTSVIISIPL